MARLSLRPLNCLDNSAIRLGVILIKGYLLDPAFKWLNERRPPHGLCLHYLIIQQHLNVVHRGQYGSARVTVWDDYKLHLKRKKDHTYLLKLFQIWCHLL